MHTFRQQRAGALTRKPSRKDAWCGMLRFPVSPTEDKKAGRSAVAYDKEK